MNRERLQKIEQWIQKEDDELLYMVDEEFDETCETSFTWEDARQAIEDVRDFYREYLDIHIPQWMQTRLRICIPYHQITQEDKRALFEFFRYNLYEAVVRSAMPEHLQYFFRDYGTEETLWRLVNTDARYHCFGDGSRAIDELIFVEVLP